MAEDEERQGPRPANDNGSLSGEAIGRQLARAQDKPPAAANDNEPRRR
jgi:hypothetical protein